MKPLYLLTLAAALAFAGCSKDDGGEPRPGELTIEKTEYALDAVENRTAEVTFSAPADWTLSFVYDDAESTADWLTVTPASGTAGEQTVELSAACNTHTASRTAFVDVVCGEQQVRLTVTQAAADAPELIIEQTEYTLGSDEERTTTIAFTAAADWALSVVYDDAESAADWLTVTPASGTAGEQTVELSATRNFRTSDRTAYVDLVCGEQSVRLTVTQAAASGDTDFTALFDPDFAKELQEQSIIANAENITPEDMERIAAITFLDVSGTYDNPGTLTTLQGIEYFESLTYLYCHYNQLTELDVRQNTMLMNLSCDSNSLTELDVRQNTVLMNLSCTSNSLTELDVSRNTALTTLWCTSNQLTELNVSVNTALTQLTCNANQLTELDVRQNTALTLLSCYSNQLTELDVRQNTELINLFCDSNSLTELDISQNTALEYLCCDHNQLKSLDISRNTALEYLCCNHNQLKSLDLSRNTKLTELWCEYNPGDGVSTFPITAWFDNDTKPDNLEIYQGQWTYDGKDITIDFRKAE